MTGKVSEKYQELGGGLVKRAKPRLLGLFIDGTGLDRAARRISRKIDISRLIRGVTSGIAPVVARYYTLIPFEDDSRHRAFLDAVDRAGLDVVVKRLPPKGINRQVSVDVEMAADIVAFGLGHQNFSALAKYEHSNDGPPSYEGGAIPTARHHSSQGSPRLGHDSHRPHEHEPVDRDRTQASPPNSALNNQQPNQDVERIITVVCPSREIVYPLSLIGEFGVDTVTADFGQFNAGDVLKAAAKWIDLSDSETIWRD